MASRIVDAKAGLALSPRRRLATLDSSLQPPLDIAIVRAVRTARGADHRAETMLAIPCRHAQDPVLLDICPARDAGVELDPGYNGAFVFAINPSTLQGLSTHGMNLLYGLTEAETAVLDCLVQGFSLDETAQSRGVSIETVRSQVKALLRKVGVADRSQLIARTARVNLPIDPAG